MSSDRLHLANLPFGDLLSSLGEKTPAPGGGAVASITLALAAHLARMVMNYSRGKKSLAEHAPVHEHSLEALEQFGARALELAEADAVAYRRLNALWKLDPDDEQRVSQWDEAVDAAIAAPQRVLGECVTLAELLQELLPASNANLLSDLAIAAVLAEAAARAAAWNVAINLPLMSDPGRAGAIREQTEQAVARVRAIAGSVEDGCRP